MYPNITPYYSNRAVFEVVVSNNRISINNPSGGADSDLQTNHIIYLTGDSAPGGLSFNTDYYVIRTGSTQIRLSTTLSGSEIDITSTGSNVKINTKNPLDTLKTNLQTFQKSVRGVTLNSAVNNTISTAYLGIPDCS